MITVRAMQVKDADKVSRLEQQIFSQPWSRQGFVDSIELGNTVFLVAEEQAEILGYIGMYLSVDEAEITNVAVAPAKRRRGIGEMLLKAAKEEAGLRSIETIVLEVRVSNGDAVRLYERNGFQVCGRRKEFYELPREDAYIMVYGQ